MSATVKREFMEEAGNLPTEEEQARCSVLIDTLFSDRKASLGHSPPPFAPFSSLTFAPPPPSQPEDALRRDPHSHPHPHPNLKVVYEGYVDDPRSTDNAWIETTAYHFHCTPEIAKQLKLGHGDDAAKAMWLRVDPKTEDRYARLWANHRDWVDEVALRMNCSQSKRRLPSATIAPQSPTWLP